MSEIKVKLSLCLTKHHTMKAYWGVEAALRPGRFIPRERALGTHWKGGWVGPSLRRESNLELHIDLVYIHRQIQEVSSASSLVTLILQVPGLSILPLFFFFCTSSPELGYYLKTGHDHFFLHTFHFSIHNHYHIRR
jgi:hypothetical protein